MEYNQKKVVVLGMGKTGRAVSAFLQKRGASVCCYDDDSSDGTLTERAFDSCDFAVISPGFPLANKTAHRLTERGIPILSEIDLAYINCKSKHIFAVSGTNGKTTTCLILKEILSEVTTTHLVGNVGIPFIQEVEEIHRQDAVVAEISSFQIEQSSLFSPEIAALTNVGEDHLDRHRTAQEYREIKLSFARSGRIAVLNGDDPFERNAVGVRYSLVDPTANYYLKGRSIHTKNGEYALPPASRGEGFDRDFLCAFAVACEAYGERACYLRAYEKTAMPLYRNQMIGTLAGATVINDSKGTNIDATLFALSQVQGSAALILGGSDKGEDYSRLMRGLGRAVRVYLVGENAVDLFSASDEKTKGKCLLMADLESCVADFAAHPLDALLFSPASASFDLYKNYEERGERFNEIVQRYRLKVGK